MIEQAASVVAADNTELATVFLQKTAVEKALPEMDKRLNPVSVILMPLFPTKINFTIIFLGLAC